MANVHNKAIKKWEFESRLDRICFAKFTTSIVDSNAQLVKHAPMCVREGCRITGEIYNLETEKYEGRTTIAFETIDIVQLDNGHTVYVAKTTDGVRYYFDIWDSTYEMKQDLFKTWLKGVRPAYIEGYLS